MTADWRRDRIGAALRGENPTVLLRMRSGFAVLGDTQFLPGYCLLLGIPRVPHLSDLEAGDRRTFLFDMSLIGEAIEEVCRPQGLRRVNYEIHGNTDPFVHAHIWPRYDWEPPEYRQWPVYGYPRAIREDPAHTFSAAAHGALQEELRAALGRLMESAGVQTETDA